MVTPEKIYDATNDGLDIISMHFCDAEAAAHNNKPFRIRQEDNTPSAWVRLSTDKRGVKAWRVTDFGGSGRAMDPIQIHMEATGLRYTEAIADLCCIFNITDELDRSINRPDVRKQPATESQPDGAVFWDIDQEFSEAECKIMGPRVKSTDLKQLNWYRVNHLITVKNREATYKYSNEHYPIFMRECWFTTDSGVRDCFYKIYEPLNVDKQWRFQYQPKGKKPQHYVNGLSELMARYKEINDAAETEFYADPENEGKTYNPKKIPEAIICSGERDALCVKSLGYFPLWFNSETYRVSDSEWAEITKYVDRVYNIPDIDETGRRKGRELALRFIDIHTIWLPDKLSKYKDNRGRPCKDFRDWMEIWKEQADFRALLELATQAKFWTTHKEKSGKIRYSMDFSCLLEFLTLQGYGRMNHDSFPAPIAIHASGNVVRQVFSYDIRDGVMAWARETAQPHDLRNLILSTPLLEDKLAVRLPLVSLDFSSATPDSQLFYFPDGTVEVTGENIIKHRIDATDTGHYVWESDVIPHQIKLLPDMFEITHPDNCYKSEDFDIDIKPHTSKFFGYLINSSRLYWRKELETELDALPIDEAEAYRKTHKFDIAGPLLAPEEIREQKRCLINKIFIIGYMLHRYKQKDRAWAPFLMDWVIGANGQCNGRSGKSFMIEALRNLTNWLKMSGRNETLLKGQFAFEQVNRQTDIVLIDDCAEYFPFKDFYDSLTGDLTINAKNVSAYNLPYEDAPKFAFTTNYVPREFDGSSSGRIIYSVFSDYYHVATEENDYRETVQISSDFGGAQLLDRTYPERDWEADLNFLMQCCRFYLSVRTLPVKIEPDMSNIIFRKYLRDMSDNFQDWAEAYFCPGSDNLDREIVREQAFDDYRRFSGVNKITMQKFTKSLKGFCHTCEWVECLNPVELYPPGTRLLRRVDGAIPGTKVQKEMIFVCSKAEAERLRKLEASAASAPSIPDTPTPALF